MCPLESGCVSVIVSVFLSSLSSKFLLFGGSASGSGATSVLVWCFSGDQSKLREVRQWGFYSPGRSFGSGTVWPVRRCSETISGISSSFFFIIRGEIIIFLFHHWWKFPMMLHCTRKFSWKSFATRMFRAFSWWKAACGCLQVSGTETFWHLVNVRPTQYMLLKNIGCIRLLHSLFCTSIFLSSGDLLQRDWVQA